MWDGGSTPGQAGGPAGGSSTCGNEEGEKEKKEAREEKMEVQWLSSCVVVEMAKLGGAQKAGHQACPLEPS